jgi:replicative DNA helicase
MSRLHREAGFAGEFQALPGAHSIELRMRKERPVDAVPTPFPSLNAVCRDAGGGEGFARGWHIVLAGRSGLGKSNVALNFAIHAARHGEAVHYISLEMSGEQLHTRALAIASGKPVRHLEQGRDFRPEVFDEAADIFADNVAERGGLLHINSSPLDCLDGVVDAIGWAHDIRGCRFFVVDYMQLAAEDPNDAACITHVSHEIRRLTQRLNVVTLALSQFNRATSSQTERPTMFGLMGGSAIENDADMVLLLDHSRIEVAADGGWNGFLIVDKNRHGATIEIPTHFNRRTLRFMERMPDELEGR